MEPAAKASPSPGSAVERAFALTSVVPVGAFAVLHVADYARVLFGEQEIGSREAPSALLLAAEVLLVWLPLATHAVLGAAFWKRRGAEPGSDASARALLAVHRISGIAIALFLLDHFVRFRLPILTGELVPSDSVQRLASELSRTHAGFPWIAAGSLLGVIAVAFHFTYGLRRIARRSPELAASRVYSRVSLGVGLVLLFAGLFTLLYLAAG
ncbi:MAG TPA: hypothetical protein VGK73_24335 [Polyangiaceae bacterium]